ncbi:unnamed protein product, partial [Symbiodinium sp. KB8]
MLDKLAQHSTYNLNPASAYVELKKFLLRCAAWLNPEKKPHSIGRGNFGRREDNTTASCFWEEDDPTSPTRSPEGHGRRFTSKNQKIEVSGSWLVSSLVPALLALVATEADTTKANGIGATA